MPTPPQFERKRQKLMEVPEILANLPNIENFHELTGIWLVRFQISDPESRGPIGEPRINIIASNRNNGILLNCV